MNNVDKITELHIKGFKALGDVTLKLDGLTVLIGDNGSGKSSILEALEIIRKATKPAFISDAISRIHGGFDTLVKSGESEFSISVSIESKKNAKITYSLAVGKEGNYPVITHEQLDVFSDPKATQPLSAIVRNRNKCQIFDQGSKKLIPYDSDSGQTTLSSFGKISQKAIQRTLECLNSTRVLLPFDTRASWLTNELNIISPLRSAVAIERTENLDRYGSNLPNCFQALKLLSKKDQERILDKLRLGLGDDLEDIHTPPASRGQIELHLKFKGLANSIPASSLSDGQLNYLAFIALSEFGRGKGILCIDEPESHLHPNLLVRLVWELENLSKFSPVILSTHSDRLLDALTNPAQSVVLCELGENRSTNLLRPDSKKLEIWLERYRGIGQIRSEGYVQHVFVDGEKNS